MPSHPRSSDSDSISCSSSTSRSSAGTVFLTDTQPDFVNVGFPYFGHEHISLLSRQYMRSILQCSDEPEPAFSHLHPDLEYFIAQMLFFTNLPYSVLMSALVLMKQFCAFSNSPRTKNKSGHRLFLAAYIVAAKDQTPTGDVQNDGYWSDMSRFTVQDIETMQRHLRGRAGMVERGTVKQAHTKLLQSMRQHSDELEAARMAHKADAGEGYITSKESFSASCYSTESAEWWTEPRKKGRSMKSGVLQLFKKKAYIRLE